MGGIFAGILVNGKNIGGSVSRQPEPTYLNEQINETAHRHSTGDVVSPHTQGFSYGMVSGRYVILGSKTPTQNEAPADSRANI